MLSVTVQLHNCSLLPNYSDEILQEFHLFPFYPLVYQPEAPFILIQLFQMGGIHESILSISHEKANCKCPFKKTENKNNGNHLRKNHVYNLSCRQPCNCKPVVFRMKIQKSDSDLTACYFCTNAYYEQLKQKPSAKIAPQTVFHQILFYIHSKSNGTGCTVNDII